MISRIDSAVSEDVVEEINEVKGYYNVERQEREKAEGEIKEVRSVDMKTKHSHSITVLLAFVQAISHDTSEL